MPHIHDKIDFTVEVFVVHKNKVLLRKHDKYGIWLSVGGHIELDEEPNEAAIREVKEEVGLNVKLYYNDSYSPKKVESYRELISPEFLNIHGINETHKHITLVYFAKSDTDKLILSENEKSEGCKWFTEEELNDPQYGIKDNIKMYAQSALKTLLIKRRISTMNEAQELVKFFSERNHWKDVPNVDKFDHLHEELIEMSQHLRYKSEEERIKFVEENKEIFKDGIGDLFFATCRLANQLGVNIEESFNMVKTEILEKYNHNNPEDNLVKK